MRNSPKNPPSKPDTDDEPDLFRALELAHYAERFRGKVFVLALAPGTPFANPLVDLKVLAGYRIQVVLVAPDADSRLQALISRSNKRGSRFHLLQAARADSGAAPPAVGRGLAQRIAKALKQQKTPVIACRSGSVDGCGVSAPFLLGAEVAERLRADKLFLTGPRMGGLIATFPRSHVMAEEIAAAGRQLPATERKRSAPLLAFVFECLKRGLPDIVLIEDRPGRLFREVFTHEGSGVLFNNVVGELVRQARLEDVTDIALLLRTGIEEGRILPVDENDIEREIHRIWVYEIDGLVVGCARLKAHGDWAELAQFVTLPRYRGKGHARTLGIRLEEEAAAMGIRTLFALSIHGSMGRLFTEQGFRPVDRGALPREWQAGYDMKRPSRAYIKEL